MYRIIVTDLDYEPQGEVKNASAVTYSRAISKLATFSFRVMLSNIHADRLAECEGYIKVYRKDVCIFYGPMIAAEEVAERNTQSLAVTCADPGWFLTKRLAGKSLSGTSWTTPTYRSAIAEALVDAANAEEETGINADSASMYSDSMVTYKAGPYKPVLDCIQELGNAIDGFEWRFTTNDNWMAGAVSGNKISALITAPNLSIFAPETPRPTRSITWVLRMCSLIRTRRPSRNGA
jgi:hypothetical protein